MKWVHFAAVVIAVTVMALFQTFGHGQQTDSPPGIEIERALPSRYEHVIADMLKFCEPAKGFWVDLGAGRGQVAVPMIQKTGNPMVMIDPDIAAMSEGLKIARERGLQDKLFAVVGKAESLPFPDNSVDLLVSRGSIFFWTDPAKGLREVYRVLRPGCRAYIGGGAGSGYPAVAALLENRRKQLQDDKTGFWKQFVELRRPEQMHQWAEQAGLPEFQVLGRGAISADDPRVGQGVWLLFEKQPEFTMRKQEDTVSVTRRGDAATYVVRSRSGIGGATFRPWNGWPPRVVLRLYLRGLESLTISNDNVELRAAVSSHGGHARRLVVKQGDGESEVTQDAPYWTKIAAFRADGKPVETLPEEGGYFELELPVALLEESPKMLTVEWIDFYRQ